MKYYTLTKEEEKLLKGYESGKFKVSKKSRELKAGYERYAKAALAKTKNINIRLSEQDLFSLKSRASQKGIPYQTLIASVLHQYSSGQIDEKQ